MEMLQSNLQRFAFSALISICLFTSTASNAISTLLYDIDFESPPHTVGLAPSVGLGTLPRNTVSKIVYGTPIVAANFGGVASQSLEFDSSDLQGDQISLRLNDLPVSNFYCFETDILINSVSSFNQPFAIVFDTPQVRTVSFYSDGTIRPFVPFMASSIVGSYSFGIEVVLRVEINLTLNQWEIFIDGSLAHSGSFGGATAVNSIRISTPVIPNPSTVLAAIDNVQVSSQACPSNDVEIDIDIKPGSDPNSVNIKSKGLVPVAVLSTNTTDGDPLDFDATQVDPSTARFGPNEAEISHSTGHIEDVDGDGDMDLVLHFKTEDIGIACGDTEATLTGETFRMNAITATDSINTVGCK